MEAITEQGLLFPVIEQKARKRSFLREIMDAIDRHGPLLPRSSLPLVLDVSRQRVHVLIQEGRIGTVEVRGREFVPVAALNNFLTEERKAGRPIEEISMGEAYRRHHPWFKKAQK